MLVKSRRSSRSFSGRSPSKCASTSGSFPSTSAGTGSICNSGSAVPEGTAGGGEHHERVRNELSPIRVVARHALGESDQLTDLPLQPRPELRHPRGLGGRDRIDVELLPE